MGAYRLVPKNLQRVGREEEAAIFARRAERVSPDDAGLTQ
jgi:hypothetical protein